MTSNNNSKLPSVVSPRSDNVKQIYEGRKFYWRQRLNCDLNFFIRTDKDQIEIVPYDFDKDVELEHMFVSLTALRKVIESEVDQKVEERRKELSKDRFKKVPPLNEITENVREEMLSQYILSRLQCEASTDDQNQLRMKLMPLSGDTVDLATLIVEPPALVVEEEIEVEPTGNESEGADGATASEAGGKVLVKSSSTASTDTVRVRRRRKTTAVDFEKGLNNLRQSSQEFEAACQRAERLSGLAKQSVNAFKDAISGASRPVEDKSTPMGRFRWAVRRVILNNTVAKVTMMLDQMHLRTLRMSGTFPSPAQDSLLAKADSCNGSRAHTPNSSTNVPTMPPVSEKPVSPSPAPKKRRSLGGDSKSKSNGDTTAGSSTTLPKVKGAGAASGDNGTPAPVTRRRSKGPP